MSITDELRDWFKDRMFMANGWQEIHDIADRIDAEHERAMAAAALIAGVPITDENMAEHGWIRLPKDADGEYIHVGDELEGYGYPNGGAYCKAIVGEWGIMAGEQDCNYQRWLLWSAGGVRHHQAPTVEDVLREFAYGLGVPVADSYIAASAAKLRLAGDAE